MNQEDVEDAFEEGVDGAEAEAYSDCVTGECQVAGNHEANVSLRGKRPAARGRNLSPLPKALLPESGPVSGSRPYPERIDPVMVKRSTAEVTGSCRRTKLFRAGTCSHR